MNSYDYIIVGSGIAGLYTALLAKDHGSVLIITKGSIDDCNTKHAQGGIAAAIGENDTTELHFQDTVIAGDGLCDKESVRILVEEAPNRIADLVNFGVPFDTLDGEIDLTMEAAHSKSRIVHAGGDATGEYVEVALSKQVLSSKIQVLENCLATEIILEKGRVSGIKSLDCHTGSVGEYECRFIILATGGAGQLYKFNTNSDIATGDGLALALNAGAEIVDMEFFQFHPTALRLPGVTPFLISEAVRGEGGILRNIHGERFMSGYSPQGDLAPRDIVARSIVYEMNKTNSDRVFVDITHLPAHVTATRFPSIYRFCQIHGLDITREMVPVAPAAHYMMGGIRTNTWGETNITDLFATGETACTGVHGANRLASNSMLEVIVFSKRIVEKTVDQAGQHLPAQSNITEIYRSLSQRTVSKKSPILNLSALQQLLWDKVGVMRNQDNLAQAADVLSIWHENMNQPTDRPSFELYNLILSGRLVTEAALLREESRGAHFRSDFSRSLPKWQRHIVFTTRQKGS